jgi:hypothetical protein
MRFSVTRLLISIAAFAIAFAAFGRYGTDGIIIASVVGISLSGISLLLRRENIVWTVHTALWSLLGGFLGSLYANSLSQPYLADVAGPITIGSFLGFVIACWLTSHRLWTWTPEVPNKEAT